MVISAFLEGDARVLAETAELMDADGTRSNEFGLELWRPLKYNLGGSFAITLISVLEMIRDVALAKAMHDVWRNLANSGEGPPRVHATSCCIKRP